MFKKFTIIFITLGIILTPYSFDFPEINNLHAQTEIYCSETISQSITWYASSSPYIISGDYHLRILPGVVLTIEPGVTVKFSENGGLAVNGGEIIAKGTEENPIIFTANHGSNYTRSGGWLSIEVYNQGKITLDYAVVEYGGFIQHYERLDNKIFKPNTALAQDYYYDDFTGAITISGSEANINNSIIASSTIGLKVMDFYGYGPSDYATSTVSVHNSEIYDNDRYGIKNIGSSQVDAIYNWWGDDSGPIHPDNPDGTGDRISGDVLFDPWIGKQEAEEIDPLILQYEPILYLHPNETYQPMNVEAYVNHCSLWDYNEITPDKPLKEESADNPITLDDLNFEGIDSSDYYLQFSEELAEGLTLGKLPDPSKADDEYKQMKNNNEVKYTYYTRKMIDTVDETGEGYIVLQYWYFYAFNDWKEKDGFNNHEGDWECVMIFINPKEDNQPKYIAYSSHHNRGRIEEPWQLQYTSVRRSWDSAEVVKQADNVISFVGVGSHANYPNNGDNGIHPVPLFPNDQTSYNGLHFEKDDWEDIVVFEENNFPKWLTEYHGRWGVMNRKYGFQGCNHPYPSQYNRFADPIIWAGVDKVGKKTVVEIGINTYNFAKQKTKLVIDAINTGKTILVDLHDEIIQFGQNLKEIVFLPHFWDIESNLENNNFDADVSFEYDSDEIEILGVDENNLIVFHYDEANNFWEKIPSVVDVSNKVITFFTTHFSRYAIGVEKWQNITEDVKIIKMPSRYNREINIKQVKVKMKNQTKENITNDLKLIIKDINKQGVELVNATGITTDGYPYIEASEPYNHCIFTGDEQDIPEPLTKKGLLSRLIKRKIKQKKLLSKKLCEKIISQYPELEDKFQYILPPNRFTQPITLEFSLPIKKTKVIKRRGQEITIYIPEFRRFDFEVELRNNVVGGGKKIEIKNFVVNTAGFFCNINLTESTQDNKSKKTCSNNNY